MSPVFSHHRPAPARSKGAALAISISSTIAISSLIGVAQQVDAERQRAFVVAPHEIILGCMNCDKANAMAAYGQFFMATNDAQERPPSVCDIWDEMPVR
ncbi:hypothetical protein [Arthrobacter sp. TMN-50]